MRVSRDVVELAQAAALSALLFATSVLVPLFGQPLGFLSSAPLVWLAARHGIRTGLLGGLLASSALLPLLPPPVTLIFAVEHALPAAALGWGLARGLGIARPSAVAAVIVTLVLTGAAFLFATGAGRDPSALLEDQLRAAFSELGAAAGGSGGTPATPVTPAQFEEILAFLRRVLPAIALVGIFLECALNTLIAARFLARRSPGFLPPNLAAFRLPESLVWAVIPALALSLVAQRTVATVAINALIPLLFAYLLQGLSIALHLAERARLSRLGRTLIAVGFAIQPWLLAAPLLLGLLDFRFAFRTRWPLPPGNA
jgi:uncharacterized protein YybS (DUF2232 family)